MTVSLLPHAPPSYRQGLYLLAILHSVHPVLHEKFGRYSIQPNPTFGQVQTLPAGKYTQRTFSIKLYMAVRIFVNLRLFTLGIYGDACLNRGCLCPNTVITTAHYVMQGAMVIIIFCKAPKGEVWVGRYLMHYVHTCSVYMQACSVYRHAVCTDLQCARKFSCNFKGSFASHSVR